MRTATAIVTGGSSGIGLVAVRRLAAAGTKVAAVDIDAAGLDELCAGTDGVRAYPCDISDEGAVASMVDAVTADLGPIDHVFHAAGICRIDLAVHQPMSDIKALFDVNLFGTVNICRAVVPGMLERDRGSLVIISSLAGWLPSPKFSAYAASKAAATAYAEALSNELHGTNVRLSCVCPTEVDTPLARNVRTIDGSAFGDMRAMSVDAFMNHVERKIAKKRPPLFVFPGVAGPLWRARRFAPDFLRKQTLRQTSRP
ncbi:SDR family NAD(P)-dependent oxidoreductase [Mycobacterium sp. NPDC051804]|uniref:SDR family NAD(P)-dependent oxidoreductase n=1 Tax=Mycobacterium sp. NPDC051804 TaxID=3364295 RepID=UPI0037A0E8B7